MCGGLTSGGFADLHTRSAVPFGVTRVLLDVLLQQSQPLDAHGRETLTALYRSIAHFIEAQSYH